MKITDYLKLNVPELTDSPPDITKLSDNFPKIDANAKSIGEQINNLSAYAVASGTNTYTATIAGITALTEGFSIKVKFTNANTSTSSLNINSLGAIPIVKGNGSALASENIKAGQVCHLVYAGLNFQLLGEGGEYGTAQAQHVLDNYTIGTVEGIVDGTMPNNGTVSKTLTTHNQEYTISKGYHTGLGKIKAIISGLVASVIKAGTIVGGVLGTFTSDATAVAGNIISGKTAYKNGSKVTGTMANRGSISKTLTTQGSSYTVPVGYHSGSGKVTASISNLSAENVRDGVNIGGVVGKLESITVTKSSRQQAYVPLQSSGIGTTYKTIYSKNFPVSGSVKFIYIYKGVGTLDVFKNNVKVSEHPTGDWGDRVMSGSFDIENINFGDLIEFKAKKNNAGGDNLIIAEANFQFDIIETSFS